MPSPADEDEPDGHQPDGDGSESDDVSTRQGQSAKRTWTRNCRAEHIGLRCRGRTGRDRAPEDRRRGGGRGSSCGRGGRARGRCRGGSDV